MTENPKKDYLLKTASSSTSRDTIISPDKVASGARPLLISDQFAFTEGPAVDKDGNVYFTDQPRDQIWKYDVDGKLSLFMEKTGRSNGMHFDEDNNLVSCADEHNELWKITLAKEITVLLKNKDYYNGPNDVWVDRTNGNIYFTDPLYKRDYWTTGRLSDKELFTNQGSDGMTMDNEGAIYLTGKGVTIYSPEGKLLQHIPIAEDWTANVCFGGKNKDILFITASKSVYTLKMNVKGAE